MFYVSLVYTRKQKNIKPAKSAYKPPKIVAFSQIRLTFSSKTRDELCLYEYNWVSIKCLAVNQCYFSSENNFSFNSYSSSQILFSHDSYSSSQNNLSYNSVLL